MTGLSKSNDYASKNDFDNYSKNVDLVLGPNKGYFKVDKNMVQLGANQENAWSLHAPNDKRNTLFIVPGTNGTNWNWATQTTINKDGDVNVGGKFTAGKFNVSNLHNGLTMSANGAPPGEGRMHVFSDDEFYVLNKKGMVVGKEWGGSGKLDLQGELCVQGVCIDGPTLQRFKSSIHPNVG